MATDEEIWEEKQLVVNARKIEREMSIKMRNILMKMAIATYQGLDTYVDNGDTEPTYLNPDVVWDAEKGGIRVIEGDRRFTIRFEVEIR